MVGSTPAEHAATVSHAKLSAPPCRAQIVSRQRGAWRSFSEHPGPEHACNGVEHVETTPQHPDHQHGHSAPGHASHGDDWHDEDFVAQWLERQKARQAERKRQFVALRAFITKGPDQEFRYLNLGAGPGNLDTILLPHFAGANAVVLDGSLAMLAEARKQLAKFGDRVEYVQADLSTADWLGAVAGPFDFVISARTIHHVGDPKRIRELYREVRGLTGHGGTFLNLEYVRPAKAELTRLGEWITRDTEANFGTPPHGAADMPGTLLEQLGWLGESPALARLRCTGRKWTWRCSAASTVTCTCPGATATIRMQGTDTGIDEQGTGGIEGMTQDNQAQDTPESVHSHSGFAGLHSHEGGAPHWHDEFGEHMFEDLSAEEFAARQLDWRKHNVQIVTVGIDIGSSTSHLMFSKIYLQLVGEAPDVRSVTVAREILYQSPIWLTPYLPDNTIDMNALDDYFYEAYDAVQATRNEIDSGAVILTGEALKRVNARALSTIFAQAAGKFVVASAGHHMEAVLAANGSGTVARSRRDQRTLLNVDIGGGSTKLALVRDGHVIATAAVAIGARLIARDGEGRLTRIDGPARTVADELGMTLTLGEPLAPADEQRIVQAWTDVLAGLNQRKPPAGLVATLMLTDPLPADPPPQALTFSGGVSEFIFQREDADFGDLGQPFAKAIRNALNRNTFGLPAIIDPNLGIRATAVGASQFNVLGGVNAYVSDEFDPAAVERVPVLLPRIELAGDVAADAIAASIRDALTRADLAEGEQPVALSFTVPRSRTESTVAAVACGGRSRRPAEHNNWRERPWSSSSTRANPTCSCSPRRRISTPSGGNSLPPTWAGCSRMRWAWRATSSRWRESTSPSSTSSTWRRWCTRARWCRSPSSRCCSRAAWTAVASSRRSRMQPSNANTTPYRTWWRFNNPVIPTEARNERSGGISPEGSPTEIPRLRSQAHSARDDRDTHQLLHGDVPRMEGDCGQDRRAILLNPVSLLRAGGRGRPSAGPSGR